VQTLAIAERAFDRHAELHPLATYMGIVSLHGLARLAVLTGDSRLREKARAELLPFVRGEREQSSRNFKNYACGGNGTAFLLWKGLLPEARATVAAYADELIHDAPRDPGGIYCMPGGARQGAIWIDVAFAVSPFLLFAGLALDRGECLEEACDQTLKMVAVFRDPANGLLHQSRDFKGKGLLSEDHWSRGNGWGMLALTELANYLPARHPRRLAVETAFVDLLNACLAVQDAEGMWHQELTWNEASWPGSYVETSGSGLILYGLGVALEKGLLPAERRDDFERGMRSYLDYITPAGDVFHTCQGCLCPGEGRMLDYAARATKRNDSHAFGPVNLAFGQAWQLGITDL